MAVTDTDVYWVEASGASETLMTVPYAGGTPATVASVGYLTGNYARLRAHGATVAWNVGPHVYVKSPTSLQDVTSDCCFFSQSTFDFDGEYVYLPAGGNTVVAKSLTTGNTASSWDVQEFDVLANGTYGSGYVANCGGIWRIQPGAPPTEIGAQDICATGVNKSSQYLVVTGYLAECDGWGIYRFDPETREKLTIHAFGESQYGMVGTDDTYAYFIDGGLHRVAVAGGTPIEIAPGPVESFAVGTNDIFVISKKGSQALLYRIVK